MDLTKKIFAELKPKAGALGFNRKELMGVAADIANNLKLEEDASDEDINAAIDDAIDAVIPMLKVGQAMATRVINKSKANDRDPDNDEGDDEGDGKGTPKQSSKPDKASNDSTPEWVVDFKKTLDALTSQVATMQGEKLSDTRRGRLKEILKDTGTFGSSTLKNFDKMTFKDNDEFEDYLAEVEKDLEALNQERADVGLSHLGAPPAVPPAGAGVKKELVTDDELQKMANAF